MPKNTIKWQNNISNRELLERVNVKRLSEEVRRRRWQRFIGHILRQQPDKDCVTALTWTPEGKRKRGQPKNNLLAHSREGEVRSRVAVLKGDAHRSARQESLESVCGGPMHHLDTRGQELGTTNHHTSHLHNVSQTCCTVPCRNLCFSINLGCSSSSCFVTNSTFLPKYSSASLRP